jgi:anti-sigma B factor antagonist
VNADGLAFISVSGEIDYCTAPRVLAATDDVLRRGACAVLIDLAGVTFLGAAGASVLLAARRQCWQRGVAFTLLRPSRPALRVLNFTDLMRPVLDLKEPAT